MKFLPILLFLGSLVVVIPFFFNDIVWADYADFVITEIMYNPDGSDTDREWVEVFNSATVSATLIGGSGARALRFYDENKSSPNHLLAENPFQGSPTIDPQTYFILARDAANFHSLYPNYTGTLIPVSMNLGNDSKTVGFRVGPTGDLFSSLTYQSSWGGNDNDRTLEKKVVGGANDSTNWVESPVDKGTPGVAYTARVSIVYPTTVRINEFLPDPQTGDEWVELFNRDEVQKVSLKSWQLDDIEGGSSPQTFSHDFDPLSHFVVYFSSSKLNNSGDSVRLIRPDGVVTDSFNYTDTIKDIAFAYNSDTFVQTKTLTPGVANIFTPIKEKREGKINELKRLPLGSEVKFEGLVTAPGNLLGDKDFYASDSEAGIKVSYMVEPSFKIEVGDKVAVESSIEESNSEKYIKTDTVDLLKKNAGWVEERKIFTGEADEPFEGMLVKVAGKLVENSGDTFYLDDGSGRVKIYIRDSTGIVKPSLRGNDEVKVIGLLSQYGSLKSGSANYRILPRFQSDIVNLTESGEVLGKILGGQAALKELPQTGSTDFYLFGWILIFLGLALRLKCSDGKHKSSRLIE